MSKEYDKVVSDIEQRKEDIKSGLIGSSKEVLDGEGQQQESVSGRDATERLEPSTKDSFSRAGMSVGGPFARKRINPVNEEDKTKSSPVENTRRGVHKIWKDRPINNV